MKIPYFCRMRKIKILAFFIAVSALLFSCGPYNKVLNKGTTEEQYAMAVKMYEAKKYSKALRLFEKITPAYRGKPQMERIQFMVAQSNFNEKSYTLSGYYFDRFTKNYPSSSKKEEAAFLSALSYKLDSPVYSKDQTDTYKALDAFQSFINSYPDSERLAEANKYYKELQYKLEKKAFEIAKNYYRTGVTYPQNYKSSIVAFENLLKDYLGTEFKEESLFYIFKASHDLVLISTERRKEERIKDAIKAYDKLMKSFPKTKFLEESNQMLATIKQQQNIVAKS